MRLLKLTLLRSSKLKRYFKRKQRQHLKKVLFDSNYLNSRSGPQTQNRQKLDSDHRSPHVKYINSTTGILLNSFLMSSDTFGSYLRSINFEQQAWLKLDSRGDFKKVKFNQHSCALPRKTKVVIGFNLACLYINVLLNSLYVEWQFCCLELEIENESESRQLSCNVSDHWNYHPSIWLHVNNI